MPHLFRAFFFPRPNHAKTSRYRPFFSGILICMALTGTLDAMTAALSEDRLLILGELFEVWWWPPRVVLVLLRCLGFCDVDCVDLAAIRLDLNRV